MAGMDEFDMHRTVFPSSTPSNMLPSAHANFYTPAQTSDPSPIITNIFSFISKNFTERLSRDEAVDMARRTNQNVYRPSSDKNALAVTTPSGKHYQYFLVGTHGDKLTTDNYNKLTGGKKSTKKYGTRKHRARKTRTRKQ
jgi:hypothetical protein